MNFFNIESFIGMLRRKCSRYLDDGLIQDLECCWYMGRLDRASSLAVTLFRKIPDRYFQLNPEILNGFEAIQQASENRHEKASPSKLQAVERSSTPKRRPYSPRKYHESEKTETEQDTLQDYLKMLETGVVENNEIYLQYVQKYCDEQTPMIGDLHRIACSTSELFHRLSTLQNQLQVKDFQLENEDKKLNDLKKHNKELSDQLMKAERQKIRLQQSVTKSDYEETYRLQLLNRNEELQRELEEQDRDRRQLSKDLRQLQQEKEDFQKRLQKALDQINQLHQNGTRSNSYEERINHLQKILQLSDTEKSVQSKTIDQLGIEKAKLQEKYTHSKKQLDRLQRELQRLETEHNQTKESKIDLQDKNEQLQKQLDQKQVALHTMKTDLINIQGNNEDLQNRLVRVGREKSDTEKIVTKLEREKTGFEDKNLQLVEQLDRLKGEIKTLMTELNQAKESTNDLQERLRIVETENSKKGNELKGLERERATLKEKLREAERQMQIRELEGARSNLKSPGNGSRHGSKRNEQLQNELEHKQMALQRMEMELQKTQAKNEDLQSKSKDIAAAQQIHDTHNLAELSDRNRPTKISEQFSELYDNEWTEAFTAIEDSPGNTASEEDIVKKLRDILLYCFEHCADISKKQLEGIKAMLLSPSSSDSMRTSHQLSTEQAWSITDLRKQTTSIAIESIKKEMCKKFTISSKHRDLKLFIERCAELCWLMVIQSPPVIIDDSHRPGARFDKDVFKAYTKAGETIDFVVWPPVYLHKGGPLLCKGTAQGKR